MLCGDSAEIWTHYFTNTFGELPLYRFAPVLRSDLTSHLEGELFFDPESALRFHIWPRVLSAGSWRSCNNAICLNPCLRCLPREQRFSSKFCCWRSSAWTVMCIYCVPPLQSQSWRVVSEWKQQHKATIDKRWFLLGLEMNSNAMCYAFSLITRIWLQELELLAIHYLEDYTGVISVFSWQQPIDPKYLNVP